jgi:hypothetical protein
LPLRKRQGRDRRQLPGQGKEGLRYLEYEFLRGFGSKCEP